MRPWLLSTALLAACTGGMQDPSTVEQQDGACIALEGRKFEAVNDPSTQLTFTARDEQSTIFQWSYADAGEAGQIECEGASITSISASPHQVSGTFDATTQKLVWEDQTYVPAN
jgi:hypothetical protein